MPIRHCSCAVLSSRVTVVPLAAISSSKGCLNPLQLEAYRSRACAPRHHGLGLLPLPVGGCGWGSGGPFLLPVGGPPPLWVWLGLGGDMIWGLPLTLGGVGGESHKVTN